MGAASFPSRTGSAVGFLLLRVNWAGADGPRTEPRAAASEARRGHLHDVPRPDDFAPQAPARRGSVRALGPRRQPCQSRRGRRALTPRATRAGRRRHGTTPLSIPRRVDVSPTRQGRGGPRARPAESSRAGALRFAIRQGRHHATPQHGPGVLVRRIRRDRVPALGVRVGLRAPPADAPRPPGSPLGPRVAREGRNAGARPATPEPPVIRQPVRRVGPP